MIFCLSKYIHVYYCKGGKIEHGLKDIQEGRVLTQEEVEERMPKCYRTSF